jgi:hypothetical protein
LKKKKKNEKNSNLQHEDVGAVVKDSEHGLALLLEREAALLRLVSWWGTRGRRRRREEEEEVRRENVDETETKSTSSSLSLSLSPRAARACVLLEFAVATSLACVALSQQPTRGGLSAPWLLENEGGEEEDCEERVERCRCCCCCC